MGIRCIFGYLSGETIGVTFCIGGSVGGWISRKREAGERSRKIKKIKL